tara:strand:+ start:2402 stop:2596 length:195 start_codon:yes stop_codon:yes gene_type:complete
VVIINTNVSLLGQGVKSALFLVYFCYHSIVGAVGDCIVLSLLSFGVELGFEVVFGRGVFTSDNP